MDSSEDSTVLQSSDVTATSYWRQGHVDWYENGRRIETREGNQKRSERRSSL